MRLILSFRFHLKFYMNINPGIREGVEEILVSQDFEPYINK